MDTRVFCVYNLARGVFLSSKVTVADGANQPLKILKVLVSGLALDSESGLWLSPLHSIPAVPRLFPFDLLYLDGDLRVVDLAEVVPGVEFPSYRREVSSALVLPLQTGRSSQTERGDQLMIGLAEEIERQLGALDAPAAEPVAVRGKPFGGRSLEPAIASKGESSPVGPVRTVFMAPLTADAMSVPENGVMVAEFPGGGATALEVPVSLPATNGHAVVQLSPEKEVGAASSVETVEKQPGSAAASVVLDRPDVVKGVPKGVERLATIDEKVAQPTTSELVKTPPANEIKSAAPAETPVVSITEVVLERPRTAQTAIINGQHGGVEDLFSNWVDAPSLASTFRPRPTLPQKEPEPAAVSAAPAPPESVKSPEPAGDSKPVVALVSTEPAGTVKAAQQGNAATADSRASREVTPQPPEPAKEIAVAAPVVKEAKVSNPEPAPAKVDSSTAPTQVSVPTRVAIPQPPPATTFTVAQYGLWRVSMPTAVSPVVPAQSPGAERPSAAAADAQSNAAGNAEANPRPAKETKAPEVSTRTAGAGVSAAVQPSSRVAEPVKQKIIASTAAETAMEKPVSRTKGVLPEPGAIADSWATKAAPEKRDPSVGDVSTSGDAGTKPAVKSSTEQRMDRLTDATRQAPTTEAKATVPLKAETPQREQPAPVARISARAAESVLPEQPAKAIVPASVAVSGGPDEQTKSNAHSQNELSLTVSSPSIRKDEAKGKPKISVPHVDEKGKVKQQPTSLGARFKRWLNPEAPPNSDRRRAHRRYVPGMIAHYYTGGAPKPHEVADISMTGFYLLTEDRWMPDTMIQMTLQKPCAKGERKQSITVLSKIVRRGSDGVAAQFVMPETLDPHSHDVQPSQATDRFALARFL